MALLLKLEGAEVKKPTDFQINKFDVVANAGRVSSGLMTADRVCKKRKFNFVYDAIRGDHLEAILSIIDTGAFFFTIDYSENGVEKQATVYRGAINQRLYRSDGYWTWVDVTFDLIER